MKAILEFDLDEPDDRIQHLRCVKSLDMACVLFEIQHNLKKQVLAKLETSEYGEESKLEYEAVEFTFEKIMELFEEHGVNIEELLQ